MLVCSIVVVSSLLNCVITNIRLYFNDTSNNAINDNDEDVVNIVDAVNIENQQGPIADNREFF